MGMSFSQLLGEFGINVVLDTDQASVSQLDQKIGQIKGMITKTLGKIGIALNLAAMNKLIEEYGKINKRIAATTEGIMDGVEAQDKLLAAAGKTRIAYKDMASQVESLFKAGSGNISYDNAIGLTTLLNQLGQAMALTDGENASLMNLFQNVEKTGQMTAEDVETLGKKYPKVLETLADGLGKTKEEVNELAKAGALGADWVTRAILAQQSAVQAKYQQVGGTVTEGLKRIRDVWGNFLAQTDKELEITKTLSSMLFKLADVMVPFLKKVGEVLKNIVEKLGGAETILRFIIIFITSSALIKFVSVLKTIVSLLSAAGLAANLTTLALVALLLIIEDFYVFMHGGESLLGDILDANGIDQNEVRDKIQGFIDKVMELKNKVVEFFESDLGKGILKVAGIIVLVGVILKICIAIGTAIAAATAPTLILVAAFAALAASVALIWFYWDQIVAEVKDTAKYSGEQGAANAVEDYNANLGLVDSFAGFLEKIGADKAAKWLRKNVDTSQKYDSWEYLSDENLQAHEQNMAAMDARTDYGLAYANAEVNSKLINWQYGANLANAQSASEVMEEVSKVTDSYNQYQLTFNLNQSNTFENADPAAGISTANMSLEQVEQVISQYSSPQAWG